MKKKNNFIKDYIHKLNSRYKTFIEWLKITTYSDYVEHLNRDLTLFEKIQKDSLNTLSFVTWYSFIGFMLCLALTLQGFIGLWLKCTIGLYLFIVVVVTTRTGNVKWY